MKIAVFLIRALGRVRATIRPRLVVVSNVVDRHWQGYLQQVATDYGVALEIKTLPSDRELVQIYSGAKLFVYAPFLEPFGLAALEAMACGTVVVAVKEGGVRESVSHDEAGFLTERDEGVFAETVTGLLSDETRRNSMGEKAIRAVREFWTLEHAGERFLHHIRRVVGG